MKAHTCVGLHTLLHLAQIARVGRLALPAAIDGRRTQLQKGENFIGGQEGIAQRRCIVVLIPATNADQRRRRQVDALILSGYEVVHMVIIDNLAPLLDDLGPVKDGVQLGTSCHVLFLRRAASSVPTARKGSVCHVEAGKLRAVRTPFSIERLIEVLHSGKREWQRGWCARRAWRKVFYF